MLVIIIRIKTLRGTSAVIIFSYESAYVSIPDLQECASLCQNQTLPRCLFWKYPKRPVAKNIKSCSLKINPNFLPHRLSRNEKWRRRFWRWKVGCLLHPQWAQTHHLAVNDNYFLIFFFTWTIKTWINFCLIGPTKLRPGWISASGLSVSTVVEIMAMNQPLADTWWV